MTVTKVPAIPAPTDDNLREVAKAVKGVIDVREGYIGDPLDRFVTLRELVAGGVASTTGSGRNTSLVAPVPETSTLDDDNPGFETYDPVKDPTVPPAPAGFSVTPLFAAVKLDWLAPTIRNYAYTEIWRANTNALGDAVRIGTSNGTSYVDYLGNGTSRYYWIRFVSQANIIGPYNSTNGTLGATAPDPGYLLEVLTGEITESQLYSTLGSRINLIDGPETLAGSVGARIKTERDERVAADGLLSQTLTTVSATAASKVKTYYQSAAPTTSLSVGDLWFDTDDQNKVYRWNGSSWQEARDSQISVVDARVTNVESAKIGYCSLNGVARDETTRQACEAVGGTWNVGLPIATAVKQVAITDGDSTLALEQRFTAQKTTNNQLLGQYSVKIDDNGHVSGFGLSSTAVNGTPTSAFIVRADRFAIAGANDTSDPLGTLNPTKLPFIVATSPTSINGVSVPAGTYINTAFIGSATITKAQVGSVYADRIEAGYTSSVDLESSVFYGSELYLGGTVTYEYNDPQRPSQKTGISFVSNPNIALKNTGAEFNVNYFSIRNGTQTYVPFEVEGGIVKIKNAFINNTQSDNYVQGSAGWAVRRNGAAEFGAASIRGQLTAAQIDTRNLTVKDAAGNVLFGAGTNLNVANISGLGSLATRDDVLIGNDVKVWNGSFFQTVNVTDFVNTLSKINTGNISTFMESAAIGSAYIGNAAVGTLKIAGEAVTIPEFAEQVTGIDLNGTPQIAVQKTITIDQLSNAEACKILVVLVIQAYPSNSTATNLISGIYVDSIMNTSIGSTFISDGITVANVGSFLVPNGTYTISGRVSCSASPNGSATKNGNNFLARLIILGAKR